MCFHKKEICIFIDKCSMCAILGFKKTRFEKIMHFLLKSVYNFLSMHSSLDLILLCAHTNILNYLGYIDINLNS